MRQARTDPLSLVRGVRLMQQAANDEGVRKMGLDGLRGLSNLKELVVTVDVGADYLTAKATVALPTLTGLEHLQLPFTDFSDLTLRRLRGLKRLRFLNLSHANGISDIGLASLAALTGLEYLDLSTDERRGKRSISD